MPRKARIDAPGALHHIVIRGIERKAIFKRRQDYDDFLSRMGDILSDTSTGCFAWALMTNHVHLLLRTGLSPISTVMRRLLTGYAVSFNKRHRRHGHLFQNRYKSFLCEEDPYLLELVRYIHLNPLRAGVVADLKALGKSGLSGHAVLMGNTEKDWQESDYVLGLFAGIKSVARRAYETYLSEGASKGRRPDLVGGGLVRSVGGWLALKDLREANTRVISDERILGSSEFAETVLRDAKEAYEKRSEMLVRGISCDQLVLTVSDYLDLEVESIKQRGRKPSVAMARAIICAMAFDRLGMSNTDIARKLNITQSAVSRLVVRGRREPLLADIEANLT
jgi:putative transposase